MSKKILCPVDFSPGADRALAKAEELAKAMNAEIELLHVYQVPVLAFPDTPVTVSPAFISELVSSAERALSLLVDNVRARHVSATSHLAQGQPAQEIVARAHAIKADLIVIGTHGRSGFVRFMVGSVAERVVRTATVPVLTVHVAE